MPPFRAPTSIRGYRYFAVRLFAGLRAAVFLAAVFRFAVVRFRVAAPFFAAVERFALFRFLVAAPFLAAVDLFFAGDIGHPLSIGVRTPCASGVAVLVRSSLPTPRTARRGEGRS